MRVVQIGDSHHGGGAAHAMSRLHAALRGLGVDSRLLVRHAAARDAVETVQTRGDADELFPAIREAVRHHYLELNRTAITNTHFSFSIDGADLSALPLVASSQVVHLHWTASFQTPADVAALLDAKPVVWTLHDVEPLTGGCHFPAGCEGYRDACAVCPQLVRDPFRITAATLRDKITLWAGTRPTLVTPSRYMADCARRSTVACRAGASIVHIPYGIDVDAFRPRSRAAARRALGLPRDGFCVLSGSSHNGEKRKGLALLASVLSATDRSELAAADVRVLTVGEPRLEPDDFAGVAHTQLGHVPVERMPTVYAAADVFIHLSTEDNFPCMLLESLSCGTPAIAFDVGGVAEIAPHDAGGVLVPPGDLRAMADALSSLLRNRDQLRRLSRDARTHVAANFESGAIARRHAELYDELATRPRARAAAGRRRRKSDLEGIVPRWAAFCLTAELARARDRASVVADESRAKSAQIAALQRQAAESAQGLADQARQVHEKEGELEAVHAVAEERRVLVERMHASLANLGATAENLQRAVREREDRIAALQAALDAQRSEIELLRTVAAERQAEARAIQAVAEERKALVDDLHAAAASLEDEANRRQREVEERDDRLATLQAMVEEQRVEIELVHGVAADRALLIEQLHRVAEERRALIDELAGSPATPERV